METASRGGRKALVTGGSRGIGYACGRRFATDGWDVRTIGRGPLCQGRPGDATSWSHHQQDLVTADPSASWADFFSPTDRACAVVQALGGNIGVIDGGLADVETAMTLNLLAPLAIHDRLLPLLRRAPAVTLVYLGSSAVWHGRGATPYVTAKAALHAWIAKTGRELARDGILLCGIAPAAVSGYGNGWDRCRSEDPDTWARTAQSQALGRFQTPDEVAAVVSWIVTERPMALAGTVLNLDAAVQP